ncbi:MAG: hypothetical protein IJT09_02255 [Abditibacteriota bacterium]|nr:hypothetical protein [Abditibacteriota bacterium]
MKNLAVLTIFLLAVGVCHAQITVDFDKKTGAWSSMVYNRYNVIYEPGKDVDITFDGKNLPEKMVFVSRETVGDKTTIVRRAADWEITTYTEVREGEVRRRASFKWLGSAPVKVTGASLIIPNIQLSHSYNDYHDDWWIVPSQFPVTKHRWSELKEGNSFGEFTWLLGKYSLAGVYSQRSEMYLAAGFEFEKDDTSVTVREHKRTVDIVHRFDLCKIFNPGDAADIGTQVIYGREGGEADMMNAFSEMQDKTIGGPEPPEYLKKNILCEVHPWGRLEMWDANDDRGNTYMRLEDLVPYYKDLGIKTLWLLPVSWPPPWVYTVQDHKYIHPKNGSAEELKDFLNAAHEADMKVLNDLVTYGINPDCDIAKSMPDECWAKNEDGSRSIVWGGAVAAADCSNKAWQDYIAGVAEYWADFGFDGTRLDVVGWGQSNNWANPDRADLATVCGGIQLNKVIRDSMRKHVPDAVEMPEGGESIVFKEADMAFCYALYSYVRDITVVNDLPGMLGNIRDWLEAEKYCYPYKSLGNLVRFLENHDTAAAPRYFGVGLSQALTAMNIFIQGTPLIYQEQETGFADNLRAWIKLRNTIPCLHDGAVRYNGAECSDPMVMCFVRTHRTGAAVVAINFGGEDSTCEISWDVNLAGTFPNAFDGFTKKKLTGPRGWARLTIPAYGPAVVLLTESTGPADDTVINLPDRHTRLDVPAAASEGVIKVAKASRWFVSTPEGYLEGDFNDMFAETRENEPVTAVLPVLGRAWKPLESGMMDGGDKASVGVIEEGGKVTRLEFDPRKMKRVEIVDDDCDGKDVTLIAEAKEDDVPDWTAATEKLTVSDMFVSRETPLGRLDIGRRHGGNVMKLGGVTGRWDVSTDKGGIIDWQHTPRMSLEPNSVVFTGPITGASWNGYQTAPNIGGTYELRYVFDDYFLRVCAKTSDPSDKIKFKIPLTGLKKSKKYTFEFNDKSMTLTDFGGADVSLDKDVLTIEAAESVDFVIRYK